MQTTLIEKFGVQGAELSELWSLDDDSLSHLVTDGNRVYGLIFLFKWVAGHHSASADDGAAGGGAGKPLTGDDVPGGLFFAKQTVQNACATQAILSVLLNAASKDASATTANSDEGGERLILGDTLTNLSSFLVDLPFDMRGESIGASEEIRSAHNSFARRDAFLSDPDKARRAATDDDDVFHFIAYVPHANGTVYELDGLKAGPVSCGTYDSADDASPLSWLATARTAIQDRIDKYAATEIKFNLMGVVNDRRPVLRTKLAHLRAAGLDDSSDEVATILAELAGEEQKRTKWKVENERREHNYLPFCMELIRSLAGSGKLPEIVKKANERQAEARVQMMAQKVGAMQQK